MKAIRVTAPGGPEALTVAELPMPKPDPGEALIRIEAIGVNFLDVYHRSGLYKLPLPFTPGSEGSGVVEEVGPDTPGDVRRGQRVVFSHLGSYAGYSLVPVAKLVPLPDEIDFKTAAAGFLQGITAQYLTTSTFSLQGGQKTLIHAAAGGVGGILVQIAKARGAYVFGTASTPKLEIVRGSGADMAIDYTTDDFVKRVLDETSGEGVDVVFDSVGMSTLERSLDCLKIRGMLVSFGQSSGPAPPVDVLRLARKSLFLTRPVLTHYSTDRTELLWRANELFTAIASGTVRIRIDRELPLSQAAEAHSLLESRGTSGKVILIPD